jgi:hypothetical protein
MRAFYGEKGPKGKRKAARLAAANGQSGYISDDDLKLIKNSAKAEDQAEALKQQREILEENEYFEDDDDICSELWLLRRQLGLQIAENNARKAQLAQMVQSRGEWRPTAVVKVGNRIIRK